MTHSFYRSYGFLAAMLACIALGVLRTVLAKRRKAT